VSEALAIVAAAAIALWGVAHVIPTRSVVAGFGELTGDNRLVITQEWIAEGLTMVFVGAAVVVATAVARPPDPVTLAIYRLSAVMLLAMASLTALTGARGSVAWFKACTLVKSGVASLLLIASVV
jgi:hypothetical protein